MTLDARRAFLTEGTRTAVLATAREDGRPHAAPIAFVLDDDDILFLTNAETVKGRDLLRDPRVALVIDDETPPFAFVMIEGTANVSRDVEDTSSRSLDGSASATTPARGWRTSCGSPATSSGRWSVWHQPGSSLVSGWVNIEMTASMRRIVPRRSVDRRRSATRLRCPRGG